MIYSDELFSITRRLDDDPSLREDVRNTLIALCVDESYRSWREGGISQLDPFRLTQPSSDVLRRVGLIDNNTLLVNVYLHGRAVIVTDTVLVPNEYRVFPFIDESSILVSHAMTTGLSGPEVLVIDPATGCGNHLLAIQEARRRIGYDINPRSLVLARFNSVVNSCPLSWSYNDITTGLASPLREGTVSSCLVLANMPIGLSPMKGVLPITSDGGRTGSRLTLALLNALSSWRPERPATALVLFYSVANPSENRWEVPDRAAEIFGRDVTSWDLLRDEKLWRVNGKKEEPNPMPLESLPRRADCRFYVEDGAREMVRSGYANLVEALLRAGWTHLAYGRLQVSIGSQTRGVR